MNPYFIPTVIFTVALFMYGAQAAKRTASIWLGVIGLLISIPAVVFAAYYTKIFGEALWLYWFRSLPFSELTAAGIGFLAGWLQHQRRQHPRLKRTVSAFLIPFLTLVCISVPYLKQIFLRPDWSKFENRWSENVCLQSSESSCGPASAATLLRLYGKAGTELDIARKSFTSRRGTENWYLLRTIRAHGLAAQYKVVAPGVRDILFPAIAGVKLKHANDAGHFVAILGKAGERFIVGDPLDGRQEMLPKELDEKYFFTGFYMLCPSPY